MKMESLKDEAHKRIIDL